VSTLTELKRQGSVKVFETIGQRCGITNVMLLYALEAAIRGCSWQEIPVSDRQQLEKRTRLHREAIQRQQISERQSRPSSLWQGTLKAKTFKSL
jgi:TfoX C-terminal domain